MSRLVFGTMTLPCAPKGTEAPLPDLMGLSNVQNKTCFSLGEEDEIYQGYGQRKNAYPYRIYTEYTRDLQQRQVRTAVLENSHVRAVFLPEYGGRLWQLTDLHSGREIVYCNDVLRGSNLAIRGPWFSGGVEWNLGVIGHTPLTMETIFAGSLEGKTGPVLRLYGYERIRALVYQMDFWLDEERPALNCHMAVFNQNDQVVPMYWWSNIASPLYPGGRLFVPAHKAYTQQGGTVHPVTIPVAEGVDVSRYETIPLQNDYFFDLDKGAPRWLAHVDKNGWGLLHSSTERLQSRKLFVWGRSRGGDRWQEFLTEKAGPYLEVQAGVGKTQYGCIPMCPQTVWQWTERYEPVDLAADVQALDFDETNDRISRDYFPEEALRAADRLGRDMLRKKAEVMVRGNGDAMLEAACRAADGRPALTPHLDFLSPDGLVEPWMQWLKNGILPKPDPAVPPRYDLTGDFFHRWMQEAVEKEESWYAQYSLGLLELEAGREDLTEKHMDASLEIQETAWAWYAKAVLLLHRGKKDLCTAAALRCLKLYPGDKPLTKLVLQVLGAAECWQTIAELPLPEDLQQDERILIWRAKALTALGRDQEAMDILQKDGGLVAPDTQECETDVGNLWQKLQLRRTGKKLPVPYRINFNALTE